MKSRMIFVLLKYVMALEFMIEFLRPRFVRQCYGCPEEASWPLPPAQPCCPAPTVEAPQQGVQGPGQSGG